MKQDIILFAEFISKNHYMLYNETKNICYWINENDIKTTEELLKKYFKEKNN